MMSCRRRKYRVSFSDAAVDFFEFCKKAWDRAWADGNMPGDADIAASQFARHDAKALMRVGLLHPQHVIGQFFAEAPMHFANAVRGDGLAAEVAGVDPALDGDMGLGFELEVAFFR